MVPRLSFNVATNSVADICYIAVIQSYIFYSGLVYIIVDHFVPPDSHRFSHAAVLEDDWESQKSRHDQMNISKEAESE